MLPSAIWYHLYKLKNVKKSLQLYFKYHSSIAIFHFFKLFKWYEVIQASRMFVLKITFKAR